MRHHRQLTGFITLLIGLALVFGGCGLLKAVGIGSKSDLGIAVETGETVKLAVETAADEVIRLHRRGQLSDVDFKKAENAYRKLEGAQKTYAEALIAWQRQKTATNDQRIQKALDDVKPALNAAADTLCSFRDLSPALAVACLKIGR
jgi:hypothetical protein